MTDTTPAPRERPMFKRILGGILDFFTVFIGGGLAIATLFGGRTEGGFSLGGMPALLLLVLIVAYFAIGWRYGGTLWQRILGVVPPPR